MAKTSTSYGKVKIGENPFTRLENAEQETASRFVSIFSDYVVSSCLELYRPGNVIVTGIEGSGKSMLLSLLKPEIRIEYFKKGRDFPICEKFLGAGINFTRSGLMDVGSRIVSRLEFGDCRVKDAPNFFGDFINYWVVRDIINTIEKYRKSLKEFPGLASQIGLNCTPKNLQSFVRRLALSSCWFGSLSAVDSIESLMQHLTDRINTYRVIATQENPKQFTAKHYETLTDIGEPISKTVSALYESEVLDTDTPVFVRFDQYEDLIDAVDFEPAVAEEYRRVVNKFLWTRDPNVSFKIGTRPYAIFDNLKVYGLGAQQIEPERHFCKIDLDDKLRRKEDSSSWLFAKFADDVFSRRLRDAGYPEKTILGFFGATMSPHKKAQMIVGKDSRKRALGLSAQVDDLSADFLIDLAVGKDELQQCSRCVNDGDSGDLLSAKLGVAWVLQGKEFNALEYRTLCLAERPVDLPWNEKRAQWWRKERVNQALLQISSNSGQRTNWSGKGDIITLSSNNILIFLNICREIWRIWDQAARVRDQEDIDFDKRPIIEPRYQSAGVYAVSSIWYNKVISRPQGDSRKKLINKISRELSIKLKQDIVMSYPGHNGFSIAVSEYESSPIKAILQTAVRYGDLIELSHTPKNRKQERRRKWYILPILSPELGLPASHTKEPYYMSIKSLEKWVFDSQNDGR